MVAIQKLTLTPMVLSNSLPKVLVLPLLMALSTLPMPTFQPAIFTPLPFATPTGVTILSILEIIISEQHNWPLDFLLMPTATLLSVALSVQQIYQLATLSLPVQQKSLITLMEHQLQVDQLSMEMDQDQLIPELALVVKS